MGITSTDTVDVGTGEDDTWRTGERNTSAFAQEADLCAFGCFTIDEVACIVFRADRIKGSQFACPTFSSHLTLTSLLTDPESRRQSNL